MAILIIVVIIIALLLSFYIVEQQTVAVIQRFGKFIRLSGPGLQFKIPVIDQVAGKLNMRVRQLDVKVETKTYDNVFVTLRVSVQYYVQEGKEYQAFYRLDDTDQQIQAYVFDVVRARVPQITLDNVFEKKDEIANTVQDELSDMMSDFGYKIQKALVTDIDPDAQVKSAMNEINTNQRLRVAAEEKGEADKIIQVKSAEAEAESKALQGQGVADQRKAIVEGLKESIEDFQSSIGETSAQDVMMLVLMTQYFDTLKDVGASSNSNTVLMPHSPGSMGDLSEQLQQAMIVANQVNPQQPKSENSKNMSQKPPRSQQ